jgi:hypothetical protein
MTLARFLSVFTALFFLTASTLELRAQGGLSVTYGNRGIQRLAYNGVVLEDLDLYPKDSFHIWHMAATDLTGKRLDQGQYTWGETNNSSSWNPNTHTWTYRFIWGSIAVQFAQSGNNLDVNVTEVNAAHSGIILDGASIYPLALHFPASVKEFDNGSQLASGTTGPSVTVADYGAGLVAAVDTDASRPLYSGFQPTDTLHSYTPILSSTVPDGLATFLPHHDRPVKPGNSDTFTVSLRFAPSGTPTTAFAADAYRNWAKQWPPTLHWKDRRIIGSVYLASSPQGDPNKSGGYAHNPRRYFNDSNPNDFDIRTAAGLASFQARILRQAAQIIENLRKVNAQGAITWDIEGEEYPQPTSYVCSPDEIAKLAPEMESIVQDVASKFHGMKLDDAYFATIRDAGFRVGVCIRPQHFTIHPDSTAVQSSLPPSEIAQELIRKMKYAHARWGATLFYVDSNVELNGGVLDADSFSQVAAALPDSLIIPEHSTPKYYAYTAPFLSFIFHEDLGTNLSTYDFYPGAFSVNLINDASASKLASHELELVNSVRRGDVLVVAVGYWQTNNPTVMHIYREAAVKEDVPLPLSRAPR